MKVLVFGQTGQVAIEIRTHKTDAICLGRDSADLTDPETCAAAIRAYMPQAVINAAAYTTVDRAEEEEALATRINGTAPGVMAEACAALGIPFIHISTDYVFSGTSDTPWLPGDTPGPLGAYGRSKLAGETAVRAAGGVHAILRTSWVFSAHGSNFLKTMLRLSETRNRLTIVADQMGGPTPAGAIGKACLSIAEQLAAAPDKSGTYHLSGAPDVCWADFARAIFAAAHRGVEVEDIPTTAFPTPAQRPANSRLDCATLTAQFGIARPDWKTAVTTIVGDLT